MARPAARFSRVSIGYVDSANTLAQRDAGDTGTTFSVTGGAAIDALTLGGGTSLEALTVTAVTADFDSVTSLMPDSTITVAVTGAADGDLLYAMKPSIWSGLQSYLDIGCTSGDTAGEVNLTCTNSGITSIDPASTTVNILRINF